MTAFSRRTTAEFPLLLTMMAALVGAAMVLPLAYLIVRAGDVSLLREELRSEATQQAFVRSLTLALTVTALATAIALPAAWLTARTDLPLRRAWSVLFALPLAIPSYVGAFAFVAALGPRGMLQDALEPFGVERIPSIYGFWGTCVTLALFTFPYMLLPLRGALQGLDRSLEEAARGLGQSALGAFYRVTLPQLRPALIAGGLLIALYTLSDFGAVSILRFDTLTRVIYVRYTSSFDRSSAAALALLLVALTLVLVTLEGATRGRARYYATGGRPVRLARLGRWRWPALAYCATVVAGSLVVPVSVIVYWLIRGLGQGQTAEFVPAAGFNSLQASSLAALAAAAAALPVAILVVRHPGRLSGLMEKLTYSGFALPGITIALALVFFAARYAELVYQTLALLVFAYVVRFLPEAFGACRAALLQVNPHTEQAALGLGRRRLTVLTRITIPQIMPGIASGAVLVFLTAMKELPVTLILGPTGFDTLATQVWSATNEGLFTRAALPALVLVVLSAIPMFFAVIRESTPYD